MTNKEQELIKLIEQATEAISQATDRIAELAKQRDEAYAMYQAVAAERDHWYSVSIGGGHA